MKSKLYILLFLGISIASISCKTAAKMYEKGNYDEAVELAAKKLQKNPDDAKLLDIIQQSYQYAVNDHESQIRAHQQSTNELKWETIYDDYASLQKMYNAIYKVPSVYNLVHPVDYSEYLVIYGDKAADIRFDRGMNLMDYDDKKSYQQAYREFQAALRFKPGDSQAQEKMEEAYSYAVTNVVVLPIQLQGGYVYSSYTIGGNNFDDQLIRDLQFGAGEFTRFYSAWEARSQRIRVDQELDLQLTRMMIRPYQDYRTTKRVSKDIVVKETVYKPDSVVKEYAKVVADITTTRRTLVADAQLQVTLRDANGRWLWSDNFSSNYNWSAEFASYTGDARALSEADKQMTSRQPGFVPSENEVTNYLLDQLNNDARYRIKNYFDRY